MQVAGWEGGSGLVLTLPRQQWGNRDQSFGTSLPVWAMSYEDGLAGQEPLDPVEDTPRWLYLLFLKGFLTAHTE